MVRDGEDCRCAACNFDYRLRLAIAEAICFGDTGLKMIDAGELLDADPLVFAYSMEDRSTLMLEYFPWAQHYH